MVVYTENPKIFENFIFANTIERHTCDVKNLRLGHDLPISVIDRAISQGFHFHETSPMRTLAKISELREYQTS